MRCLILFFLMGMAAHLLGHDVPIAHFNLVEKADHLVLDMEFDLAALEAAVLAAQSGKGSVVSNAQIKDYLATHLQLTINDRRSAIQVGRISRKGHHIYLVARVKKRVTIIEKVDFKNTCLIAVVPDHNNVLMTDINCIKRGFRLHQDRQQVSFTY